MPKDTSDKAMAPKSNGLGILRFVDLNFAVLRESIKAVPEMRYALAALGLIAAAGLSVVMAPGVRLSIVVPALIVVMVILVVFSRALYIKQGDMRLPALVLAWSMTILFVLTSFAAVSAVAIGEPEKFREFLLKEEGASPSSTDIGESPSSDETTTSKILMPPQLGEVVAPIRLPEEQALDISDARAHLRREIRVRKEKAAQYVEFLGEYSEHPNLYRVEPNRLYGPTGSSRREFLSLDSKYLLAAEEIERLAVKSDLDKKSMLRVQAFVSSYARFLAAVDDLSQQQHVVLGMYNLQKFSREATMSATDALCALDADLGVGVPSGGPVPFGCAPVHR